MQYREHPETGDVMLTQEQIDEGLAAMGDRYALHRWAYVWHPYDRLVEVDEGTGEHRCIGFKGLHVHMVLWFDGDARPTIRTVSDAFSIPSAREDRKSTRLNSSHVAISYAVFCLNK